MNIYKFYHFNNFIPNFSYVYPKFNWIQMRFQVQVMENKSKSIAFYKKVQIYSFKCSKSSYTKKRNPSMAHYFLNLINGNASKSTLSVWIQTRSGTRETG